MNDQKTMVQLIVEMGFGHTQSDRAKIGARISKLYVANGWEKLPKIWQNEIKPNGAGVYRKVRPYPPEHHSQIREIIAEYYKQKFKNA